MSAPLEVIKGASNPSSDDIDLYGDLDLRVQLFAPVLEEHELLKKKIEAAVSTRPGDVPSQVEGRRYQLQLSARRNERKITSIKKVFNLLKKRIGVDGFLAGITIPLGELIDKHTTKDEQKTLLVESRTGARTIKVVPKRPPEAA